MSLDAKDVAKIARLARIRVTEDEKLHLAAELSGVLQWVEELQQVNTDGVEPTTRDDVLANAPEAMAGFYTVPKVVE